MPHASSRAAAGVRGVAGEVGWGSACTRIFVGVARALITNHRYLSPPFLYRTMIACLSGDPDAVGAKRLLRGMEAVAMFSCVSTGS
jgi:hypothetical protein